MPDAPLSLYEREEISIGLIENPEVSWAGLARRVGRHPTTIAREVARNGERGRYRPATAEQRAAEARRRCRPRRLETPGPLRDRVIGELEAGRSPVAIWADLRAERVEDTPCVETIYQAVYTGVLGIKASDCLRSRRRRRRPRQARHVRRRPALSNIGGRPEKVNDRSEPGHWEADQIIGAGNRSSMLWLTERVSRFLIPVTMPCGYAAEAVVAGLCEGLDRIPSRLLSSVTFDQGSEWAGWEIIADTFGIDAWFCDPHSPWQRGQIENQNRQIRWWYPRGIDLSLVTPHHADQVATILNGQRRRSLDYQSPAAIYHALTVQ
ncbi:MAG TPA: IS30 family transposase [Acidimicrobiia bacterium]|nr:IS30 family transposase [Acidimicrobiia bacterium]